MNVTRALQLVTPLMLAIVFPAWTQAPPLRLFNSGMDTNGVVLPVGSVDPHITIISRTDGISGTAAYVVTDSYWIANSTNSAWICARQDRSQATHAEWTFRVPIDLTGQVPGSVNLQARVSVDDEIFWAQLNGNDLGFVVPSSSAYSHWTLLSLTNGFMAGTNYLDFRVADTGGAVSGFRLELSELVVLGRVAVFDDPAFVDTGGGSSAESDNVQASLAYLGCTVVPFTNIATAVTNERVLLFPEFEKKDLAASLSGATTAALSNFVAGGGLMIVCSSHLDPRTAALLNQVFGFTVQEVQVDDGLSFDRTADATGTAFSSASASVRSENGASILQKASLPAGSRSLYEASGQSLVAEMYVGSGKIVFLGWDWFNAAPVGSVDNGWLKLLECALREQRPPAPSIVAQPADLTVVAGMPASFTVTATGGQPLSYQWQFNGTNLAGATTNFYSIATTTTSDAGDYAVVITNNYGAATSSVASLVVIPTVPLPFALNNTNLAWNTDTDRFWFGQTNVSHDGVASAQCGLISHNQQSRLTTTLVGPGTLTFWYKVSSQTNADFFTFTQDGDVTLAVSGEQAWRQFTAYLAAGSHNLEWRYSKDASLSSGQDSIWVDQVTYTVGGTGPIILVQPTNQAVLVGGTAIFHVVSVGTPPLGYQWRFNGSDMPGNTLATLTVNNVSEEDSGNYCVAVSNAWGSMVSSSAELGAVSVACWGDNSFGQTQVVPEATKVVAISAGGWHSLALRSNGKVVAWGCDWNDQCNVPSSLTNAVAIAAGGYHSLAITADGTVTGWGANSDNQTTVPSNVTNAVAIAAGDWHSLALLSDGTVRAWGDNSCGQSDVPAGLVRVVAIAAGGNHSLAMSIDGTVVAWGDNRDAWGAFVGQATVLPNLGTAAFIGAGSYHTLVVKADGGLAAWGANGQSQCNVPQGLTNLIAVAGGVTHSLALRKDGTAIAWGSDVHGQCQIAGAFTKISAIAAGDYHNVVLLGQALLEPPRPFNPVVAGKQIRLPITTQRGKRYIIESKDDLQASAWAWRAILVGDGKIIHFTDPSSSSPQRFYRLRLAPQ